MLRSNLRMGRSGSPLTGLFSPVASSALHAGHVECRRRTRHSLLPALPSAVNRRALLVRALKKDNRKIGVDRSGQGTRYLLVDTMANSLVEVDVDLEQLAKSIGVMEPWETLAD